MKLPIHIKTLLVIILIVFIYKMTTAVVNPGIDLYNNTKTLELSYNKKVQEQVTNYDGYYLAFTDKKENANISKDVFIKVTSIIMENRRDGQNVAWKWMQENQNIPFEEFTAFYKELSNFITARYFDNMKIEREKQNIVQQHNTLLVTFPNNLYNRVLNINTLKYQFGYVSKDTKNKFK